MPEQKTRETSNSVAEFLARVPSEELRRDSHALVELMESATKSKARMWGGGIVGFDTYTQTYANGSKQDWMLVAFAPRKDRITLYVMPGYEGQDELMSRLGKFKAGKSCIHIKRLSDIHLPTLRTMIRKSIAHVRRTHR